MSEITCDGAAVLRGTIYLPLAGVWVADLEVDTDAPITGRVDTVADGLTLSGTVIVGAVSHGAWRGRIVGGAGGLRAPLAARAYRGARLSDVLADALSESGEALDAASSTLDVAAPLWHRVAAPAVDTVRAVARAAGLSWRVTAAGAIWMGAESWAPAPDGEVSLIDTDPRRSVYTVAGDLVTVLPGTVLLLRDEDSDTGVRVGDVRHEIDGAAITTFVTAA